MNELFSLAGLAPLVLCHNWSVGPRRPSDQSDANVTLTIYLSIFLSRRQVPILFSVFGLAPSATALSKRSTRAQMF